ncbi:prepilin-type N-terminal cleavage/methylation domain-containing protein [Peribacillus deserti]|uniref:Prepilin-type N-terminal cleavage/methylation domain-containing protein n=1 Tax=Peribacillus deserti TaxID=673318 RepID=A0ABS2QKI8_9BACI|nr:competence type IV pilus minor pilin ComGF [Peribacillus deserti]MBM7693284.1 prepilin-type N-terminal cleavage/methylation domain-containing protein [Peribacillus deserti]
MKDNGYIYAELLAALLVICFMISSCIPLYVQIKTDRKNAYIYMTARHLLDEQLLRADSAGISQLPTGVLKKDGIEFAVTWKESADYPLYQEGCVQYINLSQKKVELCDLAKNEKGFTLIEMLLSVVILSTLASLILTGMIFLKKDFEVKSINKMEWELFLHQINRDIRTSTMQTAAGSTLTLFVKNRTITIEKYQDKIRRRIDGSGHEILLQNTQSFHVKTEGEGLNLEVKDQYGNSLNAFLLPIRRSIDP